MPKQSLTQKYFPTDAWKLLSRRTSFGTTAYDCIKSALENPNSNVGLYAPGRVFCLILLIFIQYLIFLMNFQRSRSIRCIC
jgi:hypothetical protein